MKKFIILITAPITYLAALWFKIIRNGYKPLPDLHKKICNSLGVYPLINHYYEPYYNIADINKEAYQNFKMFEFLDYGLKDQAGLYSKFKDSCLNSFQLDFKEVSAEVKQLNLSHGNFDDLDAFIYYSLLLTKKPAFVLEVGSGISTLVCLKAIDRLKAQDPAYQPKIYCVEPFEMKWLEKKQSLIIIRKTLENCYKEIAGLFEKDMVLFIDSSHIIKPQSDLIIIFSELLHKLPANSLAHFHDIYLPFDYPYELLQNGNIFSNEQYLLGTFLANNETFKIIFSNYYFHKHFKHPSLTNPDFIPKSFWLSNN